MRSGKMKLQSLILLLCMVILTSDVIAAGTKEKKFNVKKAIKQAEKSLETGNFYVAVDLYEKILQETPENTQAAYNLAQAYYFARDYKNAEKWYQKVMETDKRTYPDSEYKLALMLKMNGQYKKAEKIFLSFSKKYRGENSRILKKQAKKEAEGCKLATKLMKVPLPLEVKHLSTNINSAYSDFAPLPLADSLLIYSSLPLDTAPVVKSLNDTSFLVKLYSSSKKGKEYEKGKLLPEIVNGVESHAANGKLSPDRKRFYFTKCNPDRKGKIICAIYMSKLDKGVWSMPEALNEQINNPKFTSTHPTVGPYKRGMEVLYFVSDREGSRGGLDIWYSVITKKGEYKEPKNLGKKINTVGDEMTPYFDVKNQVLYFSSNGHVNFGGLDVFKSKGALRKWSTSENIGYPLNSSVDDMYFILADSEQYGYFVSNRPGTIALKSETCCDDIFRFDWVKMLKFAVTGNTYSEVNGTRRKLDGARVSLYLKNEGEDDILMMTDTIRRGKKYFFDLSPEREYKIIAEKSGYFSASTTVSTMKRSKSDTITADLVLERIKKNVGFVLKNIYYDFDKATVKDESLPQLDSLLMFLRENPSIIIEFGAHTDSKGNDNYNLKLSQRRAETVVQHLIKNGIQSERLQARGYGETSPIASNTHEDGSDNPEGRALNRRTEFKVMGELDPSKVRRIGDDEDDDFEEELPDDGSKKKKKKK